MFHSTNAVGVAVGLLVVAAGVPTATASPVAAPASSIRSLDIGLELPDCTLEIYGFSACGPVVLTAPVHDANAASGTADEAQGPMLVAFELAESDRGASGCRWIAGWADLTARGTFNGPTQATLADASGLGRRGRGVDLDTSTLPRWYLALRPR